MIGEQIKNHLKDISDDQLIAEKNLLSRTSGPLLPETQVIADINRRSMEMQRRLKRAINFSSVIMIILTVILVIFTGILIWQGLK